MAHQCPTCDELCYCDMEDIDYGNEFDEECFHDCKTEIEEVDE